MPPRSLLTGIGQIPQLQLDATMNEPVPNLKNAANNEGYPFENDITVDGCVVFPFANNLFLNSWHRTNLVLGEPEL